MKTVDLQSVYESWGEETDRANRRVACHATDEMDSPIVAFKSWSLFDRDIRDLLNNGDVFGAHVAEDGTVCIVDTWGCYYPTNVIA